MWYELGVFENTRHKTKEKQKQKQKTKQNKNKNFMATEGPFGNVVLVTLFVFFENTCGWKSVWK